ncbi:hypothetical protein SAMN03159304_05058 [Pseudomonas sp. NFACC24-1]|uniref:DUF6162 family protein n=1 Tax=Pseudomonas sp. NFACC24-1 TaxID=1566189 RepID=UPI0008F24233|nr:hypothetical protein [Pseudomonas sp. NFACC24-1]SFO78898.1 hypothetical protein SAMN03159304_05058 [Pseudomonas sp. NFACC24-1]
MARLPRTWPDTDANGAFKLVRPASGRWESLALLLAALAIIAGVTGYVLLRPQHVGPPPLLSWQVRSFDGLGAVDQAIHSALLPAGEEIIWNNNDTGGWITLERAQDILLPPFYRDAFWKTNGEVHWQLILPGSHLPHAGSVDDHEDDAAAPAVSEVSQATQGQGATVYYGSAGRAPGQSAYLLVIGHAHAGVMWANQATIWVHPDPNAPYPGIVKPESLVGNGWRQVIPYDGTREVERVKGNQP